MHARSRVARLLLTAAIFCGIVLDQLCVTAAHASQMMGDVQPNTAMDRGILDEGRSVGFFNDTSFLAVPIPISNPTIGSGGAIAMAMFFKTDPKSQSSL